MKTEEKTNMPRIRIAVLGKINVGKSALTVRYLTRRFIGEYRSNTDLLYRQTVTVNNTPLEVEIIDVSGETRDSTFPLEQVQWADACVVVYSITDKQSFEYAMEALENFQKLRPVSAVPVTLLANKADLEHLREVEELEGRTAAIQNGCQFFEVSVAENSADLYQAFEVLVNECRCLQGNTNNGHHKSRKFSVSKMIGTLIGSNGKNGTISNQSQQHTQGGTVVVCQKSDLHRSRVLKRRQNFTATASL
ncbi:ras-like protein family member 11B [Zootermopsis nevadensis]|uniref:small monomeric GTPase n=1 Tax=Zootermopsis nevadensis TaxID=136037 RepID=A0A067R521_ZOONE|nr:ras-like protein family member 11B [Zootermopsis nevadensis]XP_021921993.1 ras-like protein family member 11B [Zootermopsis nevadensis]KDR18359.1 Ras-like protein family member 11B [Zootermopsis nevadensis]